MSLLGALVAVLGFHLGQAFPALWWLVALVPLGHLALAQAPSPRVAFYIGLAAGLVMYAPRLGFFHTIFGAAAALLWLVLAFWLGLFGLLLCAVRRRAGTVWVWLLAPVLWTGLEYFRSELYYLRFTWLTPGLAAPPEVAGGLPRGLGVYGVGFLFAVFASLAWVLPRRGWPVLAAAFALVVWAGSFNRALSREPVVTLRVAGAQVEGVTEEQLPQVLDKLRLRHPEADLFVLPEYTVPGEPSAGLRDWCRHNARHLVVGGKRALPDGRYFNTAFVIAPDGEVVFEQAKSVPIQFFNDGIAAREQALWNSPWGPLGLCICYDLSYTRVTDRLVAAGARALIVPTLDEVSWGLAQHELHARVAPVRAAEYGIPIVRIASSGISQIARADGRVTASAPFSEELQLLGEQIELRPRAGLPLDRWLAPACAVATVLVILGLALPARLFHRPRRKNSHPHPA